MPPPTERLVADGSAAPLLARAAIDAHKYYGVFCTWEEEGKRLGFTYPIPVVLFPHETIDQYEEAFLQRTKPHPEAARQRSQRLNFALKRARKLVGGNIPPAPSIYADSSISLGPSGAGAARVPARTRQSPGTSTRNASTGSQD